MPGHQLTWGKCPDCGAWTVTDKTKRPGGWDHRVTEHGDCPYRGRPTRVRMFGKAGPPLW